MTDTKFFRSQNDSYWDTYLAARPKYHTSNFYNRVLSYHRNHGNGAFNLAHDIACGPGQVAISLANHFSHVVASDANAGHVKITSARMTASQREKSSFVVALGEDIVLHTKPATVDFMSCAEAIALMDMPRYLEAAKTVLKPGGTLALWFYGRPHFLNGAGELNSKINKAYGELADHLFGFLVKGNEDAWLKPTQNMHCWFDNLAIGEEDWSDVQRSKINFDCEMSFYSADLGGLDPSIVSLGIGSHENVSSEIDRSFWGERWTLDEILRFIKVNMPMFDPEKFEDDEYHRLCTELEITMGGPGARVDVCWPVLVVLAAKK
ncbi:hypothetical protein E8E13_003880 [Curvularia kusanoi]|uniref:Methyltransferase domain-containing protein n=1 Tax=Curvularia kusanoi TaxID=90978 RepID=A0A9P4T564_CURKU|nr:hypothetical protein E8E13_003880 [Curvularia kusanoi]